MLRIVGATVLVVTGPAGLVATCLMLPYSASMAMVVSVGKVWSEKERGSDTPVYTSPDGRHCISAHEHVIGSLSTGQKKNFQDDIPKSFKITCDLSR